MNQVETVKNPGQLDGFQLPDPQAHLSSPITRAALRVQHLALSAVREHLAGAGFTEMLPPIIGPVTDPGGRGSKQVDVDYYGNKYKLMTSVILYKQATLLAFDKIFYIAPNVRLEPVETAGTGRHLVEFHQIDVEVANASREQVMEIAEGLVGAVVSRLAVTARAELEFLGRDIEALASCFDLPYPRRPHNVVVGELIAAGHTQEAGAEIGWHEEQVLSAASQSPFFLTDYPKGSRGFYDKEGKSTPGVLTNFDLILPGGYGELCSGGEREHEYERVVSRIRESGENPGKYGWYLKLVRDGIPASAGFGMGLERFVRYLCGLDNICQVTAYPKLAGVLSP